MLRLHTMSLTPHRGIQNPRGFLWILFVFLAVSFLLSPDILFAISWEKGEAHGEVNGYLEANVTAPLRRNTPQEDPSGTLKLEGTLDVGDSFRFRFSPKMSYDGTVLKPRDDNPIESFSKVYPGKAFQIEVDEAYGEYIQDLFELKCGIQKVQWGKLDELNPVDNINPQDFSKFVLYKRVDRSIGIPMVKLDAYPPLWDLTVEAVWVPFFVPYRMARPGERWFPPVFYVDPVIDVQYPGIPGVIPVEIHEQVPEAALPPRTFENSEVALRISKTIQNVDVAFSYFHGYDTYTPVYRGEGWLDVSLDGFTPKVSYTIDLLPQFDRIHVWGLELSAAIGEFTVRSEWAYFKGSYHSVSLESDKLMESIDYPSVGEIASLMVRNLLENGELRAVMRLDPEIALKRDSIRGGVGVDYIWKDHLLTAQILVDHIRNWDPRLLLDEFDVFASVDFRLSFMDDTLNLDLAGMYNFTQESVLLSPEIAYKITSSVKGTLRGIYIDGPRQSLIGQYKDNDQIQLRIRYSF